MEAIEAARARFRPERITTLFVGESAPASGDFFYYGNTAMFRRMQRAVEHALGEGGDFLERFKAMGRYLDDRGAARSVQCSNALLTGSGKGDAGKIVAEFSTRYGEPRRRLQRDDEDRFSRAARRALGTG